MQTQYERFTDPHGVARRWEIMKDIYPCKGSDRRSERKYDLRAFVDAIFWYLRIGSQWRNLPVCFPPWSSIYYYFRKWKADGTLERLNVGLNCLEGTRVGKEETPSMLSIDTQSVKSER